MMLIFGVKGSSIMEPSINGVMMKVMNGEARYSSFNTDIENLMLYVIYIILTAGRNPCGHKVILSDIDKILSQNRLDDLISILEEEERQDFLYDLNLVLNNREIEK